VLKDSPLPPKNNLYCPFSATTQPLFQAVGCGKVRSKLANGFLPGLIHTEPWFAERLGLTVLNKVDVAWLPWAEAPPALPLGNTRSFLFGYNFYELVYKNLLQQHRA